tara:strand:- start:2286 stop:2561 length:276 start_codon:yes stop_codon:yes gene_type:complete
MTQIINFKKYKNKQIKKTEKQLNEIWRQIMEEVIRGLMANGVKFDEKIQISVLPAFKILQNILYKAHGFKHNLDEPLDQFIKKFHKNSQIL